MVAEIAPFLGLMLAILGGVLGRAWWLARRADAILMEFESRWRDRATLVTPCGVWQAGRRADGASALTPYLVAFRSGRANADVEVPLASLRNGSVRENRRGERILALSVDGKPVFLEVTPAFLDRLIAAVSAL